MVLQTRTLPWSRISKKRARRGIKSEGDDAMTRPLRTCARYAGVVPWRWRRLSARAYRHLVCRSICTLLIPLDSAELVANSQNPMGDMQIVLAGRKIEAQYVEMKVPLYSYGCEKKIKKALSHLRGIHSVQVDYHQQKVTVWGICNREDVLAAVRKKRRAARFWGADQPDLGEDAKPGDAPKHYLQAFTAYRYRKKWKKLFPLIRL